MQHHHPILEILAVGFTLALVLGYTARRLGLSPIVGYLIAGFLIGPHTPGFAADAALAAELAEAGVILLMFGVGLHFKLEELWAVKGICLPGALFQTAVATLCGLTLAWFCGLSTISGLILGLGLAVASTVVLLRVLTDNAMLETAPGRVGVGWLLAEDILTVLILVLLPNLAAIIALYGEDAIMANGANAAANATLHHASVLSSLLETGALALLRVILLGAVVLIIGGRLVPWVLTHVARVRSPELFTLTVLAAAFATALGSAFFFQASLPLGAFLGGMVVGKSRLSHQIGADLLPLRDAFAVLFFLSVGMLLDPAFLLERPGLLLAALGIVLVVKPLSACLIASLLGYSARTGLVVGIGLAQVGEFSFILAQQAQALNLISPEVTKVLVSCAIVSIALNPSLFRLLPKIEQGLQQWPLLWQLLHARADRRARLTLHSTGQQEGSQDDQSQERESAALVLLVGYGPAGQRVLEVLSAQGIAAVVIDWDVDTVNLLHTQGQRTVYGNATKREILRAAGIQQAAYLIVTISTLRDTVSIAAAARELKAELRILVRARFIHDRALLVHVGVNAVIFEEQEVARTLAETVIEDIRRCAQGNCPVYEDVNQKEGLPG